MSSEWTNQGNAPYYEAIPIETLKSYATKGGFANGCDIDIIFPYLKNCHNLLELGACYGRVIQNLIQRNFQGKIVALERSRPFCVYLKKEFTDQVSIILADIGDCELTEHFDVIVWLWSSISDLKKLTFLSHLNTAAHKGTVSRK